MKKKVIAILMVTAMTLGLVGCGSTSAGTAPATTEAAVVETTAAEAATDAASTESASTEKIQLTYAQWGSEEEAQNTQKSIDRFNASQDRIEVKCVPIPWETYMEKLNTMATAGELPDCAIMSEAGVIQWAEQGMLYDISSMYEGSDAKPLDNLAFTYEGKPVAYSTAFESLLLYYNKDMFDKAGVEYPSYNADKAWTWDEFVATAKKLTLDKNGKTPNDADFDKDNIVQYGCMI